MTHLEAWWQGAHELDAQAEPYQRGQAAVLHGRRKLHPADPGPAVSTAVCEGLKKLLQGLWLSCRQAQGPSS